MRAARASLPAIALACGLAGCATRGTLTELGHPEFADCDPDRRLTLAEAHGRSTFHAFTDSSKDGDYRTETWFNAAPVRSGSLIGIWYGVAPRSPAGERIELVDVKVYPADQRELGIFRADGRVPEGLLPIAHDRSDKPIAGQGEFLGRSLFLLKLWGRLEGREGRQQLLLEGAPDRQDLVLLTYVRFRDGSVTISPVAMSVPPPP